MEASKAISGDLIKEIAMSLGFDACAICKAEAIDVDAEDRYLQWLKNSYHADMTYMSNNQDRRLDPSLLDDNLQSIVCLALNYYPQEKQLENNPQIAYYAYGKDYHEVMKHKIGLLFEKLKELYPDLAGRIFCDTAPILERYWAAKAGLGFIGKNSLLIIPKRGSYFFLGELMLNIELEYDKPLATNCGNCTRCISACPTQAIVKDKVIDSNRCISYQTIENKNEINKDVAPLLGNCFYGCDICQKACPWNKYAKPHSTEEFIPSEALLNLTTDDIEQMTVEKYQTIFKGSAMKRAKYQGLKRNIVTLKQYRK